MKSFLAAAALALTLTGGAYAADAKGGYAVIGAGARSCAEYTAAPAEALAIVGVWVQGYMTALNQALPEVQDVTAGRTDAQIQDALFGVCRNDPTMLLADATREVALKLVGKTGQKTAKAEAPAADAGPALRR